KYSWAPDEFFFQTMLYNSPYRENIINDNLRYINWNGGKSSPKILTTEDLTVLKASRKFFARKFNADIDYAVLDHLDEWNL
ncbi:MAG: glycosyl transferase, partial [Parapedobacter sp.]